MGRHDGRSSEPPRLAPSAHQDAVSVDGEFEEDRWNDPEPARVRRRRRRSRLLTAQLVALFVVAVVAATADVSMNGVTLRPIWETTPVAEPTGTPSAPSPSAPEPAATTPAPAVSDLVAALGETVILEGAQYRVQSPGRPWSVRVSPSTNYSRFELRSGDRWSNDVAMFPDGRQRAMIRTETRYAATADLWISFSFRWSGQIPRQWADMMSLHSEREAGENAPKPGPLGVSLADERMTFITRSDPRAGSTSTPDGIERFSMPRPSGGEWHDVVLHVRLDPWGNGRLAVWLDGIQHYDSGAIPIGYNDQQGPYFKVGLYRGASDLTTIMEFANVEVGTQSLQSRVRSPRPIPSG